MCRDKTKFLIFWELNPEKTAKELKETVLNTNQVEGIKILQSYAVPSQPMWGITLIEVESEEAAFKFLNKYIVRLPGMFKKYYMSPTLSLDKVMETL